MSLKNNRKKRAREDKGRKPGGHNKGYWYYKRTRLVRDRRRKASTVACRERRAPGCTGSARRGSRKRHTRSVAPRQQQRAKREAVGESAVVLSVVQEYLDHAKANNRPSTFQKRGEFLFDFCFGLPSRFWDNGAGRKVPKTNSC